MRYFLIILLATLTFSAKAQVTFPRGQASPNAPSAFVSYGYIKSDSGFILNRRDTNWTPRYVGTITYWANAGVDTALWVWRPFWKRLTLTSTEMSRLVDDARYLHITGGTMTGVISTRGSVGNLRTINNTSRVLQVLSASSNDDAFMTFERKDGPDLGYIVKFGLHKPDNNMYRARYDAANVLHEIYRLYDERTLTFGAGLATTLSTDSVRQIRATTTLQQAITNGNAFTKNDTINTAGFDLLINGVHEKVIITTDTIRTPNVPDGVPVKYLGVDGSGNWRKGPYPPTASGVTAAPTAGAGTGATTTVQAGSNARRGTILLHVGTSPGVGADNCFKVFFNTPYATPPMVMVAPGDNPAVALQFLVFPGAMLTTEFLVNCNTSMLAGADYLINYIVQE